MLKGKQAVIAVSGVKNSGKTTFIERVIPLLQNRGLQVAVIKHDGHELEPDVPGTDTRRYRAAGAGGCAIFSAGRYMVIKEEPGMNEQRLLPFFPEADLILLEGFKHSAYPKLELVREGNSDACVCSKETLIAVISDLPVEPEGIIRIGFEDYGTAAGLMYDWTAEQTTAALQP